MLGGREEIEGRMLEGGWGRASSRQLAVLLLAMTAAV